jgi:AcrR family transcriptional regulator
VRPAYDHTGDSAPVKPRPLRADARRNRERILGAATTAFAADGLAVPLDEIARRAGVGPGTLYRHFPAKEALWEAVLHDRLERLADEAEALYRATDPSATGPSAPGPSAPDPSVSGFRASGPGEALLGFIDRLVAEAAPKRDLADALASAGADVSATLAGTAGRLRAAIGALLAAAQRSGTVRGDIGLAELMAILSGILFALRGRPGDQPDPQRVAAVLRAGLLNLAEQGPGHAGVRDQALDHPAPDRRADRGAFGDPVSDRDDGRDLGQR